MSDFYLVDQLRRENHSIEDIARIMNISSNALYKALTRRKMYDNIRCLPKSLQVCAASEVYEIADKLRINRSCGITSILSKINLSRQNTELPRIILR